MTDLNVQNGPNSPALHSSRTEVQIYEKCPNITKDKIAKNYIILTVSSM